MELYNQECGESMIGLTSGAALVVPRKMARGKTKLIIFLLELIKLITNENCYKHFTCYLIPFEYILGALGYKLIYVFEVL